MKQIRAESWDIQKSVEEIGVAAFGTPFGSSGQPVKGLREWRVEVEVSDKNAKPWMYDTDIVDDSEFLIQSDNEFLYLKDSYVYEVSLGGNHKIVTVEFITETAPSLVSDKDQITKELI